DRGVGAFENFHEPGLEGLDLPGAAEAAFGKDADEVASLKSFAGGAEGGDDLFGLERIDRNGAEEVGQAFDPRAGFDIGGPSDHADGPRAGEHQQDAVDPTDVIGHEERASVPGK